MPVPVLNYGLLPARKSKSLPVVQFASRPLTMPGLAGIGRSTIEAQSHALVAAEEDQNCLMEQGG
jgi:hypothetical protein